MTKPLYHRSSHWPLVRACWLQEHGICVHCGGTTDLEVHHIRPVHLFPGLELVPANFMTLCEGPTRCHLEYGHLGDWDNWNQSLISAIPAPAPAPAP